MPKTNVATDTVNILRPSAFLLAVLAFLRGRTRRGSGSSTQDTATALGGIHLPPLSRNDGLCPLAARHHHHHHHGGSCSPLEPKWLRLSDTLTLMLLLLLLLLLTPNEVLKKTENRILLSKSGLGPSTNGKDLEKRKSGKLEGSNKKLENTDEKLHRNRKMQLRKEKIV